MALIKCSECDREISDQAKTCPGCGAKVPLKGPEGVFVGLLSLGAGLIALGITLPILILALFIIYVVIFG